MCVSVVLALSADAASAYTQLAHVVIAEMARNQLTASTREKADRIADALFGAISPADRARLEAGYPGASRLAILAALPDDWKRRDDQDVPLGEIYARHDAGAVPSPYRPQWTTSDWHYVNAVYPFDRNECDLSASGRMRTAFRNSLRAFANASGDRSRGIVLAFLSHLVGDAHQPLHTVARVDAGCRGDLGGNHFCLRRRPDGECAESLHALWDGGVGFVSRGDAVAERVRDLEGLYPADELAGEQNADLDVWLEEGVGYASLVYDTAEERKPTAVYVKYARRVSMQRMALAAHRLAALLERLL